MGAIATAVAWAVAIAEDSSHGYDQSSRWGPNYDCSSLVIQAWENAGVPVKTNGASYTGNMVNVFLKNGFEDVTKQVTLSNGSGLRTGDVVWMNGHVEMMCDSTHLVGASINEKGTTTGGVSGDQTGGEIRIRNYYNKPWSKVLRYMGEYSDISENDVVSGNRYLSLSEMQSNAKYIYKYLVTKGWSLEAVSGLLGNMQRESTINPAIWQSLDSGNTSGGYGLVQWTPASKLIEWAEGKGWSYSDIDTQLSRLCYEMDNGIQYYPTDDYPETFYEFSQSTKSPEYLAMAFLKNYERAGVEASEERQENARYWYDYLKDLDPSWTPSEPPQVKRKGLSLMMMYMATKGV